MSTPKTRPPIWLETILFLLICAIGGAVGSLFYYTMTVGSGAALGVIAGLMFMLMEFMWRKFMEYLGERFFTKKDKS